MAEGAVDERMAGERVAGVEWRTEPGLLGYEAAVAAMEAEATVDVMMQTIHAHPTLYEAMGEAFNAVYGLSINA